MSQRFHDTFLEDPTVPWWLIAQGPRHQHAQEALQDRWGESQEENDGFHTKAARKRYLVPCHQPEKHSVNLISKPLLSFCLASFLFFYLCSTLVILESLTGLQCYFGCL